MSSVINFQHGGKIGDTIFSLPVVKELCEQQGSKAVLHLTPVYYTDGKWTPELVASMRELLILQPYIEDVVYNHLTMVPKDTIMLDRFRLTLAQMPRHTKLAHLHLMEFNLPLELAHKPWMECPEHETHKDLVIASRTARTQNMRAKEMWPLLLEEHKPTHFLGTKQEHKDFVSEWNYPIEYMPTRSLLEAAKVIRSSKLWLGNQSGLHAILEALGAKGILEWGTAADTAWLGTHPESKRWEFK